MLPRGSTVVFVHSPKGLEDVASGLGRGVAVVVSGVVSNLFGCSACDPGVWHRESGVDSREEKIGEAFDDAHGHRVAK